ncbi:actin-histidine N-methyltransferase [Hemitrygon akajei]|nr:actin-histidine N-methyltransferase isoform X2 [Hypanus sabinus]XP_059818339.1 actin-histidine N-methyltransferase isoform X2 [Hypanus sabinus]XP_059818345.1 actin-histidine N-methyltransferase isoform X2 [Hypanus sabinus]XP_059818350.1 actin-histidine N-methyltransferase isoform X2 [Hypanus sabinus]XP_059818358.1 actin-histidine N-methyltransferase isoform X2 [Hypanus sabinus]XP_059818367.1 actin-histidine N-methyltransferase isoform X2 [Hypanus sabinus]
MGKKSRVKTQKSGGGGAAATVSTKEVMNLITELLQKCSNPSTAPGKEWEEYVQIRSLIEKIRKKQKGLSVIFDGHREHHFDELLQWAADCGASTEGFEITYFPEEGYGLKATKDIKAEELFLWIPRKMLMTVESAKNSVLGPVYSQDRILQAMGNITLAFHLLCERLNPDSFWLPYIKTLPMEYHTPLYFEEEEVRYLQSTQAIHDVFSQYKNTARQYAYFYKLIQTHPTASKLPLKESFTFDDYRWAVSSVMTRQNQIPTEDGSRVTLALIPLWDMCNHTNGLITTGYNLEDDRCECVALQDYKAEDQIYIFYGTRSNAEFVIHNGFFFNNNSHDRVKIKLGVSKSDRLYAMKAEVLARAGIPTSSVFALHCSEPPISAQLLAFLRVFCMTEDELKEHLVREHVIDKIFTLGNSDFPVSWDNEIKLWTFLETRAALLLKTYKTTTEDDKSLLEKPELSYHSKMAIQLRTAEKEILEKAVQSAAMKREHFTEVRNKSAPLPKYEESNIAMLENTVTDSKIPLILRNLNSDDEKDHELKLTEVLDDGIAGEEGILNGENTFPNHTDPERHENGEQENDAKENGNAKETTAEKIEYNES